MIARFADLSDQALIERAVEALLARRGLEYMDVYLVYWTRRDPRYNEEVAPHD